ncbi:MAG: hypothetical protein GY699_17870 [Desulfobacteraceae bacterium]|nr:hypothetical protein [Desulfobacteraceae bacterium]
MLIVFILVLFQFPVSATADDFSGTWEGMYLDDTSGLNGNISVVITQDINAITGTFSTSAGPVGTFSGIVDQDQFTGHFSGMSGGNKVIGTYVAKLRNGIIIWECIGASNNSTGTISGALTKNWVHDAGHWISLSKKNYPSSLMRGDIWASISEPVGKSIESVVLITPLLHEMSINIWDEEDSRYEIDYSFDVSNVEVVYPNGIYSFVIQFEDGTSGACFSSIAGDFPDQIPQILSPLPDALINETAELQVTWNQWLNPGPYTDITLYFDNIAHFRTFNNTATQYELPADTLPGGIMEWLKVGFSRPSYSANKTVTAKTYLRTSDHTIDDYWFGKIKVYLPSGSIGGGIIIGMDAAGIASATLIPPPGATGPSLLLTDSEKLNGQWEAGSNFATFEALNENYPDGDYILRIVYKDTTTEDITMTMEGDYPASIPNITQPVHLSNLNWWESFPAQWADLPEISNDGTFIFAHLQEIDTMSENSYLSSANEVWSEDEGILSNGMTVPQGVIGPDKAYAYNVVLVQATGTANVFKANSDVLFLESSIAPSTLSVSIAGAGNGFVVTNDEAINCGNFGGDCTAEYNRNQQIILLAIPANGSVFTGWGGDTDCHDGVVTMTTNRDCTATFKKINVSAPINFLLLR